ncbi:MAG: hypothetical protein JKX94_08680 [Sneathiella sp.]|nr:hypothetical protein [Sneathiella sp.]
MQLSEHFSLADLVKSDVANRLKIKNIPNEKEINCLGQVAKNILEPIWSHFKVSFVPSSGYRCLKLNRVLKSKDTSQHIKGEAVDIEVPGISNFDLAEWIYKNLDFDQLILEFYKPGEPTSGWVHCSYIDRGRRQEVLTYSDQTYSNGLIG